MVDVIPLVLFNCFYSGIRPSRLGYACSPPAGRLRTDIVQAVRLENRSKVRRRGGVGWGAGDVKIGR